MRVGKGEYKTYTKTYVTYRKKETHLFRIFNGLGISTSVLERLKTLGCEKINIVYDLGDRQELLTTYPNRFYEKGIIYKFKLRDYQRILPLIYFKNSKPCCSYWLREKERFCTKPPVINGYCLNHHWVMNKKK